MMTLPTATGCQAVDQAFATKNLACCKPLYAPRRLTAELVARLTADITSGKLAPGARLPTEQEMIAATGVSRTVIREAVAALRADRLVVTRQGVGAFVADHVRRPFRVDFDENSPLREVLNVMELRTGVEVEAAGLAAERASPATGQEDRRALRRDPVTPSSAATTRSIRISPSIAPSPRPPAIRSSGAFWNISAVSSSRAASVWGSSAPPTNRAYLDIFQREHRQILQAIAKRAPSDARAAMQRHLLNSRARYEKLAAEQRKPAARASA